METIKSYVNSSRKMPSNYEIWREGNGLSEPGDAGWCLSLASSLAWEHTSSFPLDFGRSWWEEVVIQDSDIPAQWIASMGPCSNHSLLGHHFSQLPNVMIRKILLFHLRHLSIPHIREPTKLTQIREILGRWQWWWHSLWVSTLPHIKHTKTPMSPKTKQINMNNQQAQVLDTIIL